MSVKNDEISRSIAWTEWRDHFEDCDGCAGFALCPLGAQYFAVAWGIDWPRGVPLDHGDHTAVFDSDCCGHGQEEHSLSGCFVDGCDCGKPCCRTGLDRRS